MNNDLEDIGKYLNIEEINKRFNSFEKEFENYIIEMDILINSDLTLDEDEKKYKK